MTDKEKYRDFCKTESSIPIFSLDWWLDAVCGEDGWNVALIEKKRHRIVASLPFRIKKKWGFTFFNMPRLTQTMGPWISSCQTSYTKKLTKEKKVMNGLLKKLPAHDLFRQNFHHSITNWLPFYWQDYSQTTRYTYIIPDLSNLDRIWSDFCGKIRTDIRKAKKNITVRNDLGLDTFYRINTMSFERQGTKVPYSFDYVERIDRAAAARNARQIFFAIDNKGRIHAATYIIWDQNSAYYLMGGANPELRNSGAQSLLTWEAIRFSSTITQQFDFEGSMIESVERSFRAFGARQIPYFQIKKVNSKLLKLMATISALKKL
jgi:hypothetical protein